MKPDPDEEAAALDVAPQSAADPLPPRVPFALEGVIGALLMGLLCLITFANVVTRYFTDVSLAFTEEFSVAMMVVLALAGAGAAFGRGSHIRMGFVADQLPPRGRLALEALVLLLSLVLFALLAWYGARLTLDEFRFEVGSPGLGVPQWLYTVWLPLCCLAICARIGGRLVRVLRARRSLPGGH